MGNVGDDIPLAQSDIAAAEDIKSIDKTYGYKNWDVTNMVRDWIANPNMNFGLLLNSDSSASSDSNRFFASSEADPNQRPKLVVTYTVGDDTTAPGDVSGFTATSGPGQITLTWTDPTDTDFAGVMIRYRTDGTNPQNKDDGLPIPNDNDGKIAGSPSQQNMSYVHTNLDPETHYYYSAFSYDRSNNYSQTAYADAQPLSPNNAPVIQSFTGVPSSLNNPGETTTFNVSATDPDGDALTYTINFGDGTNGSGSQVVHAYEAKGTYTATATVDDGNGHSVGRSLQVTVNDIPPAKPTNVSAN